MLRGLKEIMEASVAYGKLGTLKEMIVNHGLTSLQRFNLLKIALRNQREPIAEFLLESDCKEDSCKQYVQPGQKTLLHLACENWCDSVAALCIRQGDDVNCRDSRQRTPLFYCKSAATAKLLLENGALIDVRDEEGKTPLHLCSGDYTARVLLEYGALIDARDEEGKTPLHCCRDTFTARLLLDNGAPVDIQDNSGLTPLISMLCSGDVNYIGSLLVLIDECGVEPDLCNEYMHLQKWFSKGLDDNEFGRLSWHAGKARASCGSHQSDKLPFSALLILESGQVNRRHEYSGNYPLHYCENVAVAQLLLANGAQVNVKNKNDQTPLHCCINVEVANLLLKHGAPIDERDSSGLTPLMRMLCNKRDAASIRRCFGLINELGVTFDQSEQFKLLVEWARGDQDDEGFSELLKHGIDAQTRSSSGLTVLHYVVENGLDISIVGQLKRFVDVNAVDNRGYSLVHTLLDRYDQWVKEISDNWSFDYYEGRAFDAVYDRLQILLEENPDINLNVMNNGSDTPLHMAIHTGHGEFVDLLLERGADPNILDGSARTPLILAARFLSYHPERHIKSLLDHANDMFFKMPNGDTVFDYADAETQQVLIDYMLTNSGRSLIDKVDREANTALHYICKSCQIDQIRRIDLDSLYLNVVNNSGETPLQVASKAGRARTVELLLRKGAGDLTDGRTFDGLTPLHIASVQERIEESEFANIIASHLEQCGLDIDARDKVGKTPLHYAIDNQSVFRVKLLLENGADANAVDHMGRNSLYRAIKCRKLDIVELILNDRKVDATGRFADGKTPLHLVAACYKHPKRAIKLLLGHDLDVDQLDATGNTPLFAAMCNDGTIEPWLYFGANLDQLYWIDKHSGLRLAKKCDTHTSELLSIRLHEARLLDRIDCNDHYQDDNMSDYTKKCQDEVARLLKRRKLIGHMSHYEFLHNADPSIAKAVSDSSCDINSLAVDFPIYGNLIKGKIKMDLFRNNLMPSASHKLHSYLIRSPNLSQFSIPREIAWRILIHLWKNELVKFVGLSQHR